MNSELKEALDVVAEWLWNNPRALATVIERDEVLAELREITSMVARQEREYRKQCELKRGS